MELSKRTEKEISRLITVKQASRLVRVSEAVIWRKIYMNLLPHLKLSILVDPDDVKRVVRRRPRGRPRKYRRSLSS